jgi:hypothetical protein
MTGDPEVDRRDANLNEAADAAAGRSDVVADE